MRLSFLCCLARLLTASSRQGQYGMTVVKQTDVSRTDGECTRTIPIATGALNTRSIALARVTIGIASDRGGCPSQPQGWTRTHTIHP